MTFFKKPIETPEQAKSFIERLAYHRLLFHISDDPKNIISYKDGVGEEQLFTDDQCYHLSKRVDECFTLLEDPHEHCCVVMGIK